MAHSYIFQPADIAPALNAVDYLLQAESSGAGVYTAKAYLSGTNFDEIILDYTLDADLRCWIRIGEILKANLPINFINGVGNGDGQSFDGQSLLEYTLSVVVYKNGSTVGGPGAQVKKAIRAGLDYTKFITSSWIGELLGNRYTSILPKKRTIQLHEYFCISAYLPEIVVGYTNFEFYCYKSDGTLIPGGSGDGYAISSFVFTSNVINIMTTFNELNVNPSWGNIFANINDVAYFEVFIRDVDTGTRYSQNSDAFRYYIKRKSNLYPLRSFLFFNSIGGYDVITFSGEKISTTENESQEAEIYYPANYSLGQPQSKSFNQRRNDEYKINSGHISTAEWLAAYQDFIYSEDIYEMVNLGDLDAALPIKLKKSKFKLGQDNQTNQSLEIEYSYRFENFGFTNLLKVE